MPNWCVQNWILRGPKEDVQRFCDTVNSCLENEGHPNGFGKFWLGNLFTAFGYGSDEETMQSVSGLRGTFDPDEEVMPCLSCSRPEYRKVEPTDLDEQKSEVRFSITSAWGPSDWFEDMIDEKFPTLYTAWHATDEFGNFHYCHNGHEFGIDRYEVETWGMDGVDEFFSEGQEQQVADLIKELTNSELVFTAAEIKDCDDFYVKLRDWMDSHEDDDDSIEIYVHFWEEE